MLKEGETAPGSCNGGQQRPRRLLPRFSLRRLLYSSPIIGRRIARATSSTNRSQKGKKNFYNNYNCNYCCLAVLEIFLIILIAVKLL